MSNKDLRRKRTNLDFSKHKVYVHESDKLLVHLIKIPNDSYNYVRFINTNGIMAVTGDFGNWIFCREFHPSEENYVSGGYWDEKLGLSSTQQSHEFDSETAQREIKELLEENEFNEDDTEFLNDLSDAASGSEYEYIAKAMDHGDFDSEMIPEGKKRNIWLDYIYDAFDEICNRIEAGETFEQLK